MRPLFHVLRDCLGVAGAANLQPNIKARQSEADGFAQKMGGQIEGFKLRGLSQRQMVAELISLGIRTAKGNEWSLIQLQRVIKRLDDAGTAQAE